MPGALVGGVVEVLVLVGHRPGAGAQVGAQQPAHAVEGVGDAGGVGQGQGPERARAPVGVGEGAGGRRRRGGPARWCPYALEWD